MFARSGPGKAMTVSGASSSGCKTSRADVVPSRDRSPERYRRYDAWIAEASALYLIPEPLVRAVFATLREALTEPEADDLARHLPNEVLPLWYHTH